MDCVAFGQKFLMKTRSDFTLHFIVFIATFTHFQIDLFEISVTTGRDSSLHYGYRSIWLFNHCTIQIDKLKCDEI